MFEIETSIAEGQPLRRSYERQMRSKPRELANEPNLDAGMAPIQDIIRLYVKSFHKPSGTLDDVARNAKGRPGARSGVGTEEPRKNRNTRKWSIVGAEFLHFKLQVRARGGPRWARKF